MQAKVESNDANSRDLFYDGGRPKREEPSNDVLVTLLRQTDRPLTFTLEPHLGDNREGDIWCEIGILAVAIECKRPGGMTVTKRSLSATAGSIGD